RWQQGGREQRGPERIGSQRDFDATRRKLPFAGRPKDAGIVNKRVHWTLFCDELASETLDRLNRGKVAELQAELSSRVLSSESGACRRCSVIGAGSECHWIATTAQRSHQRISDTAVPTGDHYVAGIGIITACHSCLEIRPIRMLLPSRGGVG